MQTPRENEDKARRIIIKILSWVMITFVGFCIIGYIVTSSSYIVANLIIPIVVIVLGLVFTVIFSWLLGELNFTKNDKGTYK